MSDDVRETATVEDGEVLPPTVRVEGDVPAAIVQAVEAAVEAEPNACDSPKLWSPDAAPRDATNAQAVLTARFNETPATGDDGELLGWRAPYQAREDIDAVLRDALPDDLNAEAMNASSTGFYAW